MAGQFAANVQPSIEQLFTGISSHTVPRFTISSTRRVMDAAISILRAIIGMHLSAIKTHYDTRAKNVGAIVTIAYMCK